MNTTAAVWDVNRWLREDADIKRLMNIPRQNGIVPFFPIQQEPESRIPFFRYIVRTNTDSEMWFMRTDTIIYILHDNNLERATRINNVMIEMLSRLDESAQELNNFLDSQQTKSEFIFHTCSLLGSLNPEPAGQEAGIVQKVTTFNVQYMLKNGRGIQGYGLPE